MSMYGCNFKCELAVVLSLVPLKKRWAELHIDTKKKDVGAKIADKDDPDFGCIWLMPSLNWGQIRNSTAALGPPIGKYQSYDQQEPWAY